MAPQMKGLTQFILDLRNSNNAIEERKRINLEINNIQAKFALPSINSYQKKKYVCKLIYIHLLGLSDEVSFALEHVFPLMSSKNYLEKQLGYIGVAVFLRGSASPPEYLDTWILRLSRYLVRDLQSNSEETNALALQLIASSLSGLAPDVRISENDASAERWTELSELVYGLCVSPISVPIIKKRALLALLLLLQLYPLLVVANDNWIPRLLTLLDDPDPGLVLCVVPLARLLTSLKPKFARSLTPAIANLLYCLVVDTKCPKEYLYYDVPAPWLVVKLLLLIEHFFLLEPPSNLELASLDPETVGHLRQVVSKSILNASKPAPGQPYKNSQASILFQAVALASFLDASQEAISGATLALVQLLDSLETNTRYLVLDALSKLSARSAYKAPFVDYLDKIFASLNDKDISVRKKALDLLYIICDKNTHTQIINTLLNYFVAAESSLRSDISVKIAVLAEQYATDSIWYVSTMLRLLSIGGNSSKTNAGVNGLASSGEVWERIIQIIVNNEDLQVKTCRYIINLLKKPDSSTPENLVKVAAFALGEFGYRLNNGDKSDQFGIHAQFGILLQCYTVSTLLARPLLMNAFLKMLTRFPDEDFVPDILDLFELESFSLDLEVQTRAHQFLKVATMVVNGTENERNFARTLVQPLPPFESKKNNLVEQLGHLTSISGKSSSTLNVAKTDASKTNKISKYEEKAVEPLLEGEEEADPFGDQVRAPPLSPNWYDGYHRMLQFDVGIFYEDQLVKITYRIARDGPTIQISFTIINNAAKSADASITAFLVQDLHIPSTNAQQPKYSATVTKMPSLQIAQKSGMEITIKLRQIVESKDGPIVSMSYKCSGSFNTLNLKIPVAPTKFMTGTSMSSLDEFKKRWVQIGESLGADLGEHKGLISGTHRRSSSNIVMMLQRLGLAIIQSSADHPHVAVLGAGILRTLLANYGVLVTIRGDDNESKQLELAVRSTSEQVPEIVFDTIRELFDFKH